MAAHTRIADLKDLQNSKDGGANSANQATE